MELSGHALPWMPQLPCGAGLAPSRYSYPVQHKIWDRVLVCLLVACRDSNTSDDHTRTLLKGLTRKLYNVCAIKKRRVHLKAMRDPEKIQALRAGLYSRLDSLEVLGGDLSDDDRRHLSVVCRLDR